MKYLLLLCLIVAASATECPCCYNGTTVYTEDFCQQHNYAEPINGSCAFTNSSEIGYPCNTTRNCPEQYACMITSYHIFTCQSVYHRINDQCTTDEDCGDTLVCRMNYDMGFRMCSTSKDIDSPF